MSVLIDRDIRARCTDDREFFGFTDTGPMIEPFCEDQLQPASYDVRLGNVFQVVQKGRMKPVNLSDASTFEGLYTRIEVEEGGFYMLPSKRFVLACTQERVSVPPDVVARIESKSKNARAGLIVETAGYVDPGFRGVITMELFNQLDDPIILEPGVLIAQFSFETTTGVPDRLYGDPALGSHFQDDDEAVGFRLRS